MGRTFRGARLPLFVGLASLAVSCIWRDDLSDVTLEPRATATEHRAGASTEAIEAATATCYLAAADRAELVDRLTQDVAEIQAGIDRLAAESNRVRGAARALTQVTLEAMRRRWALTMKRLETAERARRSTWDDAKSGPSNPAPRCGMGLKKRACG